MLRDIAYLVVHLCMAAAVLAAAYVLTYAIMSL